MCEQPTTEFVHQRLFGDSGALPAFDPVIHLPFDEPLWFAQGFQAYSSVIDGMEGRERIDQGLAQATVEIRAVEILWWHFFMNDQAAPAFHHEEGSA